MRPSRLPAKAATRSGRIPGAASMPTEGSARAGRSAQHTELAQHAEQIQLLPVLDQPPVPDAVDVDAGDGDQPAGGGHAGEVPGMGPVALHRVTALSSSAT